MVRTMKIEEILGGAKRIAVMGHVRPDGDCVGSCMGLYHYLKENMPECRVQVYLEDFSESLRFMKDSEQILADYDGGKYDLAIALDSGDEGRIGAGKEAFAGADRRVCIDHHISNRGYGDAAFVEPQASSTSEVLFYMMDPEKIGRAAAECLYTGLVHDTGIFCHSNVTEKTMRAAGALVAKGIPFTRIIRETFQEKTYVQHQITGRALLESILFFDGKCIFTSVTRKEMEFYQVTPKDLDGIVDQLRQTKGVECAIFLYETAAQEYKVSMRSNDYVDVSRIAADFGGGGHVRAAGCTMTGSVHDVINNISEKIEKQLLEQEAGGRR